MAVNNQPDLPKTREPPFTREVELIRTNTDSRSIAFPPLVRFRGHKGPIRAFQARDEYLQARFATPELDSLRNNYLWLAGLPGHIRPLHRLEAQGLDIVVTEEARMHMIWSSHRIHLMPLDRVLIDYSRFRICFCEPSKSQSSLYGAALGLLLSYIQLIAFDSDLRIAQRTGLIPDDIKFEQWTNFTTAVMCTVVDQDLRNILPPRWDFGLLRLDRVNIVYRLKFWRDPPKAILGYYMESLDYSAFLVRNFRWLFVVFAYASIVLNALQVGLATTEGRQNDLFNRFGWVAAISVMALLALGIASVFGALLIIVLENALFAIAMLRRAFQHTRNMSV